VIAGPFDWPLMVVVLGTMVVAVIAHTLALSGGGDDGKGRLMKMVKLTDDGYFYPFVSSDFDFDHVVQQMGLSPPQEALLKRLIPELEIHIWFSNREDDEDDGDDDEDNEDDDNNHLQICVFWEGDDGGPVPSQASTSPRCFAVLSWSEI